MFEKWRWYKYEPKSKRLYDRSKRTGLYMKVSGVGGLDDGMGNKNDDGKQVIGDEKSNFFLHEKCLIERSVAHHWSEWIEFHWSKLQLTPFASLVKFTKLNGVFSFPNIAPSHL